jgi:hypothetical protein
VPAAIAAAAEKENGNSDWHKLVKYASLGQVNKLESLLRTLTNTLYPPAGNLSTMLDGSHTKIKIIGNVVNVRLSSDALGKEQVAARLAELPGNAWLTVVDPLLDKPAEVFTHPSLTGIRKLNLGMGVNAGMVGWQTPTGDYNRVLDALFASPVVNTLDALALELPDVPAWPVRNQPADIGKLAERVLNDPALNGIKMLQLTLGSQHEACLPAFAQAAGLQAVENLWLDISLHPKEAEKTALAVAEAIEKARAGGQNVLPQLQRINGVPYQELLSSPATALDAQPQRLTGTDTPKGTERE